MSNQGLGVYLNDHLAGAAAGLDLLGSLRKMPGYDRWAEELEADIEEDRLELQLLMNRAGVSASSLRQMAGWVAEKLSALKTSIDDSTGGPLQQLELLEALELGIEGKRALWKAAQTAATYLPSLQHVDYRRLIQRAENQRETIELRRLQVAMQAFSR